MKRRTSIPDPKPSFAAAAMLFLAMLALAGCAAKPTDIVQARYLCDGGVTFGVAFDRGAERATVTFPGLRPLSLAQARTGSGFRYADRRHELRGKGDEALWTESDGTQLRCKATPTPR